LLVPYSSIFAGIRVSGKTTATLMAAASPIALCVTTDRRSFTAYGGAPTAAVSGAAHQLGVQVTIAEGAAVA
jgi:hypothetical protein